MNPKVLGKVSLCTIAGEYFRASAWTIGHLQYTLDRLAVEHPKARMVILQTCYHTGVKASAGTHDKDGVLDVQIIGLTWAEAQTFLRSCGWAAWYRHTGEWAASSAWHIHMATIPPGLSGKPSAAKVGAAYKAIGIQVGLYIDGGVTTVGKVTSSSQIVDYFAHAYGLAGQHNSGADRSWFPPNITATIYNPEGDDMPKYTDWDEADRKALATDVADAVWAKTVQTDDSSNPRYIANILVKIYNKAFPNTPK